MCLVNDNETFSANKHFLTLHVGVEAKMGINIHGGEVLYTEGVLRVTEGAGVDLLCYGYEGYPAPQFVWLAPVRTNLSATLQIYEVGTDKCLDATI